MLTFHAQDFAREFFSYLSLDIDNLPGAYTNPAALGGARSFDPQPLQRTL